MLYFAPSINPSCPAQGRRVILQVDQMSNMVDFNSYPLSASLTRRVVQYLNIYRMVITMLLGMAYFGDLLSTSQPSFNPAFANATLISYMVFASYHLFSTRREQTNFYQLATYSLITDIVFFVPAGFRTGRGGRRRGNPIRAA